MPDCTIALTMIIITHIVIRTKTSVCLENGSDRYGDPNTDWNDAAYKTGVLHKHGSTNGGTENARYMASVGYLGQTGILPNSENAASLTDV